MTYKRILILIFRVAKKTNNKYLSVEISPKKVSPFVVLGILSNINGGHHLRILKNIWNLAVKKIVELFFFYNYSKTSITLYLPINYWGI